MNIKTKAFAAVGAIVLATSASGALALTQGTGTTTDPAMTTTEDRRDEGGDEGKWGLLGLLGLAGLMGLKRGDRDDDRRGTTGGTGTTR